MALRRAGAGRKSDHDVEGRPSPRRLSFGADLSRGAPLLPMGHGMIHCHEARRVPPQTTPPRAWAVGWRGRDEHVGQGGVIESEDRPLKKCNGRGGGWRLTTGPTSGPSPVLKGISRIDFGARDRYMAGIDTHGYTPPMYPVSTSYVFSYRYSVCRDACPDKILNGCCRLSGDRGWPVMDSDRIVRRMSDVLTVLGSGIGRWGSGSSIDQ